MTALDSILLGIMFAQRRKRRLDGLVADHARAVREFIDRAQALDETRWLTPRVPLP